MTSPCRQYDHITGFDVDFLANFSVSNVILTASNEKSGRALEDAYICVRQSCVASHYDD